MPKKKNVRTNKKSKKKASPSKKAAPGKKPARKKRPTAKKSPSSRGISVETFEVDVVSVAPTAEAPESVQEEVDDLTPDIGGSE